MGNVLTQDGRPFQHRSARGASSAATRGTARTGRSAGRRARAACPDTGPERGGLSVVTRCDLEAERAADHLYVWDSSLDSVYGAVTAKLRGTVRSPPQQAATCEVLDVCMV